MSNWDYTDDGRIARNLQNGRFLKGHIPHNRGKKWAEWMDGRKQQKVRRIGLKNLEGKGRMDLGGWNARKVVALRSDGKPFIFISASEAARVTGLIGRNIIRCCQGKCKHCGKFRWFYWESDEWVKIARENEQI